MAKFRLLRPAYMQRHAGPPPSLHIPETGVHHASSMFRGTPNELLDAGTEVTCDHYPGPYVECLDDAARELKAAWDEAHPNLTSPDALDPTRHLPNGVDPLLTVSFDEMVRQGLQRQLDTTRAKQLSGPDNSEVLDALVEGQKALTAAVAELVKAQAEPRRARA